MFLADDVVAQARADRRHPRDEIFRRLELVCTRHLQLTAHSLFELQGRSFVRWRATIEELSGMAALAPDGVYLDHLVQIVSPMANGRWREGSGFERHLAVPWVLTALAGCLDTHRARLANGQTPIEGIVAEFAEFLSHEQATTSWGDMERVAFNHTIIAYAALGAGAIALLDSHPEAPGWLEHALEATRRFLDIGLTSAGVTWEGLSYCGYDFKYLGVFLSGLRARGLEAPIVPPGSSIEAKLRRVPVWYAHETLPRGSYLQNYNESMFDPHRAVWGLLLSFGRYEPDLCAAVWDRLVGAQGQRSYGAHPLWSSLAEAMFFYPEPSRAKPFERLDDVLYAPDVGYLSARDSWTENATVFAFNSGPFYERARLHDQADNNSFTLVARGAPMIIDSGDGNDVKDAPQASSLGHNLVLVDGLGEHPPGPVTGVSGRIVAVGTHSDAVCVIGDATESYCFRGYNPVQYASRSALFVRRPFPYLVVHDDIQK
ncbi:MAG: heparinase II/III domain-containing protein, partial [Acidimicrobiia bacterium]